MTARHFMSWLGALVVAASSVACQHDNAPVTSVPAPPPSDARGEELTAGAKMPSFRLERLDVAGTVGIPNGKVTILTFIATWNAPAQKSLPKLEEIYLQHASRGLEVIAVAVDDYVAGDKVVDRVREFGARNGATYPFTWDKDRAVVAKVRPTSMPSTYIVDRNAVVRFIHRGYHDGESDEIAREAASLL